MSRALIEQACSLLDEMKAQATSGTMIAVRVPGQIDAVKDLLKLAMPAAEAPPDDSANSATDDITRAILEENAEFISLAVHEMRLPLTSIRGYSDMIGKELLGSLNEQQMQFMDTIRANTLRLDQLISDVNDISKLHGGRLHLEPNVDTAGNILKLAERDANALAEEREQRLLFVFAEGLPLLSVDSARVAQALGALIKNALLYSPQGSTVTVRASTEGDLLRVTVTDEGIGMTEEEQTHLGELFWRSDNDVVREIKGHGLGYAIASGLVGLMGGEMFHKSAPGQGSTFGFTLPGIS